ncbi:hypothetical protein ACFSQ3_00465 [Sphingobacterium corticis]|uniref:Uncharacterized protein n=1 Tax=Sphingobacterium corticis TaxID=1812823 RepID=A0ABW5NE20_9SPHI
MRIYWHFYKTILLINVFLSLGLVLLLASLSAYPFVFGSIGYLLTAGLVRIFEQNSMYFYYNLGFSRVRLHLGAFGINMLFSGIFYALTLLFHPSFDL